MKFKVKAEDLFSALKATSELFKERITNPIFSYYHFHLEDDTLTVTSSNDNGIALSVNVKVEKDITETYEFLIPQRIKEIVSLISGDIELDYETPQETLVISYKSGKTELGCMETNGYAKQEFKTDTQEYTAMSLPVSILKNGISFCIPFLSDSPIRPVLGGVYMDIKNGKVSFVGTDQITLAIYKDDIGTYPDFSCNLIGKYANILMHLLEGEQVSTEFNGTAIKFSNDIFSFVFPVTIGNYPNYERIIPATGTIKATTTINKADISHSATMVGICTSKTTKLVKMTVSGENMTLSGEDIDNGSKASGFSSCLSADFKIALNVDKLKTAISSINSESIKLDFVADNRPIVVSPAQDNKYMILIMPTNL